MCHGKRYEFNIRRRATPKLILFATRSRTPERVDFVEVPGKNLAEILASKISAKLTELGAPASDDGSIQKLTLSLGGGGEAEEN